MNLPLALLQPASEVANAREHGLIGNGTANDQPALAALVERLGRSYKQDGLPRLIYCPPGNYLLADATTVWQSGVSLVGAGAGVTRFVLANAGNPGEPVALAHFTEQQHAASRENALVDCTFSSFEIDGARVDLEEYNPHAKGLDLQYMVRATFRDLYIHDTAATGLGCDHLQDSVIEGVIAQNCGRLNNGRQPGGAGIGIGIGGWGGIERCSLNDCIAVGNATNGIFVELQQGKWPPPRGIKITGGHCVGNRFGISDWGAEGLIVCACVMCENLEVGFDVSAQGTSHVGGRGGLVTDCVMDGNGRDGVSIGNTHGAYTVRGNRISHNGRYGYHQHNIQGDDKPALEMAIEGNEIWKNGLDGLHVDAPMLDATIVRNRVRANGVRRGAAAEGEGRYDAFSLVDEAAQWREDEHKGKSVLAAGMSALIASNTAHELSLFPHRPGATSAWEKGAPRPGTRYLLQEAPAQRPGIGIAARLERAWIRDNRVWDSQHPATQTDGVKVLEGGECRDCRVEDNDP